MDYLFKSSVAGLAANAMEGKDILDINDKLIQTSDAEWAGSANDVINKICSYINNGASNTCSDINTGYDEPPDHPSNFLKEEGLYLIKSYFESNMNTSMIMKLFLEYEKEDVDVKTGGGFADMASGMGESFAGIANGASGSMANLAEGIQDSRLGDIANGAGENLANLVEGNKDNRPADIASDTGDSLHGIASGAGLANLVNGTKGEGLADLVNGTKGEGLAGIASGAGLANLVNGSKKEDPVDLNKESNGADDLAKGDGPSSTILPPKDGVKNTEPTEIMSVWSNKVSKQIECSKFVHERIKKLIHTIYRNTLNELNNDGSNMLKELLQDTRLKFRTKINNERINAIKELLDALKPYLSLEDDNLRKDSIKKYLHATGNMYYYLINEDTTTDYSDSVKNVKSLVDNVKDQDELKYVVSKMAKKYDDFINALDLKFNSSTLTETNKEGSIVEDIMRGPSDFFNTSKKNGGSKNNKITKKHRYKTTKKRRIKYKNRTR